MKHHLAALKLSSQGKSLFGKSGHLPFTNEELNYFEQCQPIVFATPTISPKTEIDPKAGLAAAPFSCFSIEVAGDVFIGRLEQDGRPALRIIYLLCKEIAPMDFVFLALATQDYANYGLVELPKSIGASVASIYINRIKYETVGIENTRVAVQIGAGKAKRKHRIRRIVHVLPKKMVKEKKDGELRNIDFSHRFNVRGHWRKIDGVLGKDRNDDYTIYGYTWVRDHEKGPEHLPLIKKARLVDKSL